MKKIFYISLLLILFSCTKEKLLDNTSDILSKQSWRVSYSDYGNEMDLGSIVNFFSDGKLTSFISTSTNSKYNQTWVMVSNNDSIKFSLTGFTNGSKTYRTWGVKLISDTEIWLSIFYPYSNFTYQIRLRKN